MNDLEDQELMYRLPILNNKGEVTDVKYVNLALVLDHLTNAVGMHYVPGTPAYIKYDMHRDLK